MKCLCLQALSIVYGKCCNEIGPFTDTKYIMGMLDRVSGADTDKLKQYRIAQHFCMNGSAKELNCNARLAPHKHIGGGWLGWETHYMKAEGYLIKYQQVLYQSKIYTL